MPNNVGSINPAAFPDKEFALYSIPAYDTGRPQFIQGKKVGSNKQLLEPGDVLLSKIVPHIRRTWVVENWGQRRVIGSTEWIVFRSQALIADFLRFALLDDDFHRQFMATTSGVGGSLTRARPSLVARLEIPLPPLSEQRRIAGILREQMAAVERARRRRGRGWRRSKPCPPPSSARSSPNPPNPSPPAGDGSDWGSTPPKLEAGSRRWADRLHMSLLAFR
jgi:type I restriction enzyme S subunit